MTLVNVVSLKRLQACWLLHASAKKPMKIWYRLARKASWSDAAEVVEALTNVSVLNDNRFVFNIKGNDFRIVAKIHFKTRTLFVRFAGSHTEYDQIDANKV